MAKIKDYPATWFHEHLRYDPDTGQFRRLKSRQARYLSANPCVVRADGYAVISVEGKTFSAHRVAFVMMGQPVPEMIDHDDRNRANNRWKNLVPTTPSSNLLNSATRQARALPHNIYPRGNGKFRVMIVVRPDRYDLGSFATLDEAIVARDKARRNLGLD